MGGEEARTLENWKMGCVGRCIHARSCDSKACTSRSGPPSPSLVTSYSTVTVWWIGSTSTTRPTYTSPSSASLWSHRVSTMYPRANATVAGRGTADRWMNGLPTHATSYDPSGRLSWSPGPYSTLTVPRERS